MGWDASEALAPHASDAPRPPPPLPPPAVHLMSAPPPPRPPSTALAFSSAVVGSEHVKPGKVLFLGELVAQQRLNAGKSVRVIGRLTRYDAGVSAAVLSMQSTDLRVSTALLSSFTCRVGCLVQVIGEVQWKPSAAATSADGAESSDEGAQVTVVARVYRELEEWDMAVYEAVVLRKRAFEERLGLR